MDALRSFETSAFLPTAAETPEWLDRLSGYLSRQGNVAAEDLFAELVGRAVSASSFHLEAVHHIAIYAGDYRNEPEYERWCKDLAERPEITEVRSGPSHIAPRHHGTPGYWLSCRFDGRAVEMFSCKHTAPWSGLAPGRRRDLMSHFAVSVDAAAHVQPLLSWFAHYPDIEVLAFSSGDDLGHVYGHLFNRRTGRVLEVVYDPARVEAVRAAAKAGGG